MPRKKVSFSAQPEKSQQIEDWVASRDAETDPAESVPPSRPEEPILEQLEVEKESAIAETQKLVNTEKQKSRNTEIQQSVSTEMQKSTKTETQSSPKMKRLTIDIPPDIHRKLKAKAALEGTTIVDLVRPYLEELVKDL